MWPRTRRRSNMFLPRWRPWLSPIQNWSAAVRPIRWNLHSPNRPSTTLSVASRAIGEPCRGRSWRSDTDKIYEPDQGNSLIFYLFWAHKMIKEERHTHILSTIGKKGKVDFESLSKTLKV